MARREYILFDGRATGNQGTDDALALTTCHSKQDAIKEASMYHECACYSYEVKVDAFAHDSQVAKLVNERWEFDHWANIGIVESTTKHA